MGKIVIGPAQMIPLDRLVASTASVRRIGAGMSLAELAKDIGRRGLLHSLSVRPVLDEAGAETGRYAVVAGGRRLAALQLLVKAKRLNKTAPVPCTVGRTEVAAEEDSLAENTMREALHPLDQFRAFRALREERGLGEEEIAARFFVTPAVVRQRLRLAAVSPKLLDLYAEGGLTLEQLMAFAATGDHARQEAAWDALCRSHTREPWAIRRLLAEGAVRASDKRALFVGLAAYEAAGGVVERDLFDEDGGGYLRDSGLLTRLAGEKLDAEAEQVRGEGWLWVEAATDLPYGHGFGLRRLASEPVPLDEERQAEHDRLRAEADALEVEYATAEDMPEAADRTLTAIAARLAEIEAEARAFDPAEVARAGAFVSVGHDGALRIERGYVRPADEPPVPEPEGGTGAVDPDSGSEPSPSGSAAPAAARTQGDEALHGTPEPDEDEPDDGGRLPERLVTELTAHRTLALRAALSSDPDAALLALLHALVLRAFYAGAADTCLEVDVRSASLAGFAPGLVDAAPARALAERHAHWQGLLPRQARDLWPALVGLDADSRAALLAVCVGRSVNALVQPWDRRTGPVAHADRLTAHLGLDMAAGDGWTPTVGNYLGRVTKAHILAAVREVRGEAAAERIATLRKPEMAEAAEHLLTGTGWLPMPLRTPGLASTGIGSDQDVIDGAAAGPDAGAVRDAGGEPEQVNVLDGAPTPLELRDAMLVAAE